MPNRHSSHTGDAEGAAKGMYCGFMGSHQAGWGMGLDPHSGLDGKEKR